MERGNERQHGRKQKLNATGFGKDQQEKSDHKGCRTLSGFLSFLSTHIDHNHCLDSTFRHAISQQQLNCHHISLAIYESPFQGIGEQGSPLGLPYPHRCLLDFGSYLAFIRQYFG